MTADQHVREQLTHLLTLRQAHMTFEDAVNKFPQTAYNLRPTAVQYSFWHLLEHLRICQWDILDYIRNPDYKELKFPDELWPAYDAEATADDWNRTITMFQSDRDELVRIVNDPATDLYAQIPHGHPGHTVLREILVVADHNAYHIGEFGVLRQVAGMW
ncbi:MAG: DinB family protein [Anaerolineae bacterium]|nr:MAG: DinB superfamily protein [Chloroflexi bacterium OLB13]MBW7880313.1 DinB family protein [Anaerolineae bacterium]